MPISAAGRFNDDNPKPQAGLGAAVIPLPSEDKSPVNVDPDTGVVTIETDDGGVIIDLDPEPGRSEGQSEDFDENLAEWLSDAELNRIAADVLEGIAADLQSRTQWESNLADAMAQLGLQKEAKASVDVDTISKCRHPILLECVLDFWANFVGEFLPADGPVKVRTDDADDPQANDLAERLEQDFNHYLTVTATEYYPDTSRAGFRIGFIGGIVKKVFYCALRERPVSEAIYLEDLIVSNDATDLDNAKRVTHRMMYLDQDIKELEDAGVWVEGVAGDALGSESTIRAKIGEIEGVLPNADRPQDKQHTIYECHTKRLIEGDAKAKSRSARGLPSPYKITLDKEAQKVKAIYRLWKDGDEFSRKRQQFVPWFYAPGLGFLPIGMAQILGNDTTTLTALWREMVDGGMFANFPGFLYLDSLGRQDTNRFRIPPSGGQPIKAPPGMRIQDAVMPVPYKDVTPGILKLAEMIETAARRKAGASKIPVGEGKTDVPVGSLLMFIEQATKVLQAAHKGLHTGQKREFELFKDLFAEYPESLTKFNDDRAQQPWTSEQLKNANIAPASDPNTPSHIHRIAQALALFMMATQAPPGTFDNTAIAKRIFHILHINDPQELFAPPAPPTAPQADPAKIMAIQQKERSEQRKAANEAVQAQQKDKEMQMQGTMDAANLASKERVAGIQNHTELVRLAVEEKRAQRQDLLEHIHGQHELAVGLAKDHLKAQASKPVAGVGATA